MNACVFEQTRKFSPSKDFPYTVLGACAYYSSLNGYVLNGQVFKYMVLALFSSKISILLLSFVLLYVLVVNLCYHASISLRNVHLVSYHYGECWH